ncbi:hypothetical protein GCM10010282_61540 [Streptomyces roseolus]|nr:hypothetical protein GCM10010282_61540 [Streptomyces roseolus]
MYAIVVTVAELALRRPGPVAMIASEVDDMTELCGNRVRLIGIRSASFGTKTPLTCVSPGQAAMGERGSTEMTRVPGRSRSVAVAAAVGAGRAPNHGPSRKARQDRWS